MTETADTGAVTVRPAPGSAWWVPLCFVAGATSQYLGAALGIALFGVVAPATVAWLRVASAGALLTVWRRPWRGRPSVRRLTGAGVFGLVTLAMNVTFYEAIARIPLGSAVAIEFAGPISVAAAGSRRVRDGVAVGLAAAGVLALSAQQLTAGPVRAGLAGVLLALAAAVLWAGYIVLGKRVADSGAGLDGLAVGMAVAAVMAAPVVLGVQALTGAAGLAEPRTWLIGAAVGALSTAVPYALDQVVLRRVGRHTFALLLALLPATATVVGALTLRQLPGWADLLGIAAIVAAVLVQRPVR